MRSVENGMHSWAKCRNQLGEVEVLHGLFIKNIIKFYLKFCTNSAPFLQWIKLELKRQNFNCDSCF